MNHLYKILIALYIIFLINPYYTRATEEITRGRIYKPSNDADFEKMIDLNEFVVADFYAGWCSPCKQMDKVITSLAEDDSNNSILFIKVDIEKHHTLAAKYHVYSLPTIVLFVDGKPINTIYGYRDKRNLKQLIDNTFFKRAD